MHAGTSPVRRVNAGFNCLFMWRSASISRNVLLLACVSYIALPSLDLCSCPLQPLERRQLPAPWKPLSLRQTLLEGP